MEAIAYAREKRAEFIEEIRTCGMHTIRKRIKLQ